ncbi:MAG: TetR/AcrR family transcriptional regulator [Ilumatobacteraceae bacterium]
MLNYHFGTREGLLEAVVNELANRRLAADVELFPLDGRDGLRARWEQLTAPERSHDTDRLFFELAAIALRRPEATERFRADYAEPWLEISARSVENTPIDAEQARIVTRLDIAVLRGLLLDLLVTGDNAEIEEAFEVYARLRRAAIDVAVESMAVGD